MIWLFRSCSPPPKFSTADADAAANPPGCRGRRGRGGSGGLGGAVEALPPPPPLLLLRLLLLRLLLSLLFFVAARVVRLHGGRGGRAGPDTCRSSAAAAAPINASRGRPDVIRPPAPRLIRSPRPSSTQSSRRPPFRQAEGAAPPLPPPIF
jgi:hypothetical protein